MTRYILSFTSWQLVRNIEYDVLMLKTRLAPLSHVFLFCQIGLLSQLEASKAENKVLAERISARSRDADDAQTINESQKVAIGALQQVWFFVHFSFVQLCVCRHPVRVCDFCHPGFLQSGKIRFVGWCSFSSHLKCLSLSSYSVQCYLLSSWNDKQYRTTKMPFPRLKHMKVVIQRWSNIIRE